MKKLVLSGLASAALLSAPAQLFSPESIGGAFWGSLIGGIAGGDCRHGFSGEGAAIGAGIGLLAGALAGEARRQDYYNSYNSQPVVYAPAPAATVGYGYGSGGSSAYVYYTPNAYSAPGYYYRPTRPNYAVGGTLLGAASGALIGEGASGKPGGGAAIGAAAGLVLGGIAEHTARKQEQHFASTQPAVPHQQVQQPAPPASTPAAGLPTPDSRPEIASRPCATSTYYWTTPPHIPNAPGVPDAPRF